MPEMVKRKTYHLSIIRETAAELGGTRHPRIILESFLMSAQGGIGALGGFAALTDKTSEVTHLIVRGDNKISYEQIKTLIRQASDHILARTEQFPFYIIPRNPLSLTYGCALILACPIEDGRLTFLGLAPAMHTRDYDEEDRLLVMNLASLFQISLNAALFSTRVELLNAELQKRNTELDRQVFHLNGLRELSMEAGESVDVNKFLTAFLPTLLGRFSRHQGMVVLHDRNTGTTWLKSMGIQPEPVASPMNDSKTEDQVKINDRTFLQVDRLLFLCLAGVQNKHIPPLHIEPVIQLEPISSLVQGFVPETAFLFLVREQMYGAVLLGKPLEDRKLSAQEKELLSAFVSQSVLHLKNADSFATIVALNENLARQNQILRQTIDNLTRAEHRISALETAARRISQMISRNAERLMQVRPLDFILIIGISLVIGAIFNFQNPRGIPFFPLPRPDGVTSISVSEAQQLMSEQEALLIDARPREFFEISHARGAVNVPPSLFDVIYAMRFNSEDPERPLIIYGRTFSRLYDEDVARRFFNQDHERIYLAEKGPEGFPVSGGKDQ